MRRDSAAEPIVAQRASSITAGCWGSAWDAGTVGPRGKLLIRYSRSEAKQTADPIRLSLKARVLTGVASDEAGPVNRGGYLVDPASSHMLVSKIKPCMSKYKLLYTVKLRMAH